MIKIKRLVELAEQCCDMGKDCEIEITIKYVDGKKLYEISTCEEEVYSFDFDRAVSLMILKLSEEDKEEETEEE